MQTALITGSFGAGKSTFIAFLQELNQPIFKADLKAKEFLKPKSPCYSELKELFGDTCLKPGGGFDTKKIAQLIFKSLKKKQAMEAIIHPLVRDSFKSFVKQQKTNQKKSLFYEAPLISQNLFTACDKQILITCPKNIKIKRLFKKGWAKQHIEERLAHQILESKILKKMDYIIDNSGSLKNLQSHIAPVLALMA